jgi:hypothetical protein
MIAITTAIATTASPISFFCYHCFLSGNQVHRDHSCNVFEFFCILSFALFSICVSTLPLWLYCQWLLLIAKSSRRWRLHATKVFLLCNHNMMNSQYQDHHFMIKKAMRRYMAIWEDEKWWLYLGSGKAFELQHPLVVWVQIPLTQPVLLLNQCRVSIKFWIRHSLAL